MLTFGNDTQSSFATYKQLREVEASRRFSVQSGPVSLGFNIGDYFFAILGTHLDLCLVLITCPSASTIVYVGSGGRIQLNSLRNISSVSLTAFRNHSPRAVPYRTAFVPASLDRLVSYPFCAYRNPTGENGRRGTHPSNLC